MENNGPLDWGSLTGGERGGQGGGFNLICFVNSAVKQLTSESNG